MTFPELYASSPTYCHRFFDLVESNDLLTELENDRINTISLYSNVPVSKEHFAYDLGKWTVCEILRHVIDCERIYVYRALRFSRFDATDLPGFDENHFMNGFKNHKEKLIDLIEEFDMVRRSSISFFKSLTPEMLKATGSANNMNFSSLALGFCVVGHNAHHSKVLKERYLYSN